VNPTGTAENVSVNIELDSGAISQTSLPSLPANGQVAFDIATQFPATAGHRGQAEFYVSSGNLSIAAFRFNPTVALTSIPVTLASGSPIIGAGGGGGGGGSGSLPQFVEIVGSITSLSGAAAGFGNFGFGSISGSGYGSAVVEIVKAASDNSALSAACSFSTVAVSGYTFMASGPQTGTSCYMTSGASNAAITSGSMTITFAPQGAPSVGNFTGSVNLVSGIGTISGNVSGSYTAISF
jgi:hypothetical protein